VADGASAVAAGIPEHFHGWPTRFGWNDTPVTHHVEVLTIEAWLAAHLGFDPRVAVTVDDWLSTPQQLILEVTAGPVFHDDLGDLERIRAALEWYPRGVWLWMMACQWRRVSQEEAFVGRAAEVGDEMGSRLVAGRVARDLVRLCFLVERRYAPYSKWLGTAFSALDSAADVGPALERALAATRADEREAALVEAYEAIARRHNALGVTDPVEPTVRLFYGRPFRVLFAQRFVDACVARVTDSDLRSRPLVGAIDQFVDST